MKVQKGKEVLAVEDSKANSKCLTYQQSEKVEMHRAVPGGAGS